MHDDGVLCVPALLAEECKPVDVRFSIGSDFFCTFFPPRFSERETGGNKGKYYPFENILEAIFTSGSC